MLTQINSVHILTRKLGFCLIFGFFISSCITLETTERAHRQITKGNYGSARSLLDKSLNEEPNLVKAQFLKAYTYYLQAQNRGDISSRTSLYSNMVQELGKTLKMSRNKNEVVLSKNQKKAENLIESAWSLEYESARTLWESSELNNSKLQRVVHHTQNAAAVAPDSSKTYLLQANALNRLERFEAARTALAKFSNLESPGDTLITDQLGYLYLKSSKPDTGRALLFGDNISDADESRLRTLANSYRQNQLFKPATEVLNILLKNNANNANSRHLAFVTANTYYHYFQKLKNEMMEQAWASSDSSAQLNALENLNHVGDSLAKYTQLVQPVDSQATRWAQLGTLHQNLASYYLSFRNFDKLSHLDTKEEVSNQLNLAARYLEKAATAKPAEKSYWDQLYQIYRYLNDTGKAKKAMKNSNYNPETR